MTTLLLVRHGETDWNAEGRLQGQTDTPLNDYGRRQALALADRLADRRFDAIYASDLSRARETAEILATRLDLAVDVDPDLREKDWGSWEGLTTTQRETVELIGESTEAHRERTLAALHRIAARHPGGSVLVVTHGGSIRRVQAAATGIAMAVVDNCGTWAAAVEDGVLRAID